MALQFNTYAKVTALLPSLLLFSSTTVLKIYPSSVSFPATATTAPAGELITFTNFTTTQVGNQLKLSGAPGTTAAAALSGVPSWFHFTETAYGGIMIGNSVGLSGSSPVITLNSMSLTAATTYTLLDITLTMV